MPQDPGALPRAIIEAVFAAIDSGDIDRATRRSEERRVGKECLE